MLVNKAWLVITLQNPTNEYQCIFHVCKLVSQVEVCATNDLTRLKHEAGLFNRSLHVPFHCYMSLKVLAEFLMHTFVALAPHNVWKNAVLDIWFLNHAS